MCLMVYKELEGLVNFIIDILRLHLLGDEIRDDGVNPEVELLDGLLSVLTATLGTLQAVQQHFDLKLFDVKLSKLPSCLSANHVHIHIFSAVLWS